MGWLAVTHDPNLSTAAIMAILKALSSSENVDKNYPPTYLAHGLADTTVPYNQSVMLANRLAKNNITHVLNLVPGATTLMAVLLIGMTMCTSLLSLLIHVGPGIPKGGNKSPFWVL